MKTPPKVRLDKTASFSELLRKKARKRGDKQNIPIQGFPWRKKSLGSDSVKRIPEKAERNKRSIIVVP